jgi:hypothetical protein
MHHVLLGWPKISESRHNTLSCKTFNGNPWGEGAIVGVTRAIPLKAPSMQAERGFQDDSVSTGQGHGRQYMVGAVHLAADPTPL